MTKLFAALMALAFLLTPAWADIYISPEKVVRNEYPGYCMWCALETVGRQLGIKKLEGLTASRKLEGPSVVEIDGQKLLLDSHWGHPTTVDAKLAELGVKAKVQRVGTKNTDIITEALKANRPVAVTYLVNPLCCHAVVLEDLNDAEVRLVDSNNPAVVMVYPRSWFDERWTGYVVDLQP